MVPAATAYTDEADAKFGIRRLAVGDGGKPYGGSGGCLNKCTAFYHNSIPFIVGSIWRDTGFHVSKVFFISFLL